MNAVRYYRPKVLPELYAALDGESAPVLWMAGGTDVLVQAREPGRFDGCAVFDLTALEELRAIEDTGEALVIGGGVTHARIADSPLVRRFAPPLRQASAQVGAQQLRNRATIGGNIANASPAGDTLAPLAVLDAAVELDCLGRRRSLPLTELVCAPGRTALEEREFIRAIRIPKLPEGVRGGFRKIGRRRALAISRLTVAAVLGLDEGGGIKELRLSLGAVFPRPLRFPELEALALGAPAVDERLEEIALSLSEKIPEIAGRRASTVYKQPVCRLACQRLLKELRDGYDDNPL